MWMGVRGVWYASTKVWFKRDSCTRRSPKRYQLQLLNVYLYKSNMLHISRSFSSPLFIVQYKSQQGSPYVHLFWRPSRHSFLLLLSKFLTYSSFLGGPPVVLASAEVHRSATTLKPSKVTTAIISFIRNAPFCWETLVPAFPFICLFLPAVFTFNEF